MNRELEYLKEIAEISRRMESIYQRLKWRVRRCQKIVKQLQAIQEQKERANDPVSNNPG